MVWEFKQNDFDGMFNPQDTLTKEFVRFDEKELRALCRFSVEAFPDVTPLRSFTFVGATLFDLDIEASCADESFKYSTGFGDEVTMKDIAKDVNRFRDLVLYLIRSGIPVDPCFIVDTPNLLTGQDYLETSNQSDVVILGYLVGENADDILNPSEDWKVDYYKSCSYKIFNSCAIDQETERTNYKQDLENKNYHRAWLSAKRLGGVCSRLNTEENWSERLRKADPKIIISYHAQDTLPIHMEGNNSMRHVVSNDYSERSLSKAIACEIARSKSQHYYVEMAISEPFAESMLHQLTDQTLFGLKVKHDFLGSHMPDMSTFDGHGYFEGAYWMPYAPYKIPHDSPISDVDKYADMFWAFVKNPNNPECDNIVLNYRFTPEIREVLKRETLKFFGGEEFKPVETNMVYSP